MNSKNSQKKSNIGKWKYLLKVDYLISCVEIDERTKDIFLLKDYIFGTTSLEDVFLKLNTNEKSKIKMKLN